jgi:hypothetical protein
MNNNKIVGIFFVIFLLIALFVAIGFIIYFKFIKPKPTQAPTNPPIPENRNTVYQIKGKLVRHDPDLYTGAITKTSYQRPDYVKLVHSYGRKRFQPDN